MLLDPANGIGKNPRLLTNVDIGDVGTSGRLIVSNDDNIIEVSGAGSGELYFKSLTHCCVWPFYFNLFNVKSDIIIL